MLFWVSTSFNWASVSHSTGPDSPGLCWTTLYWSLCRYWTNEAHVYWVLQTCPTATAPTSLRVNAMRHQTLVDLCSCCAGCPQTLTWWFATGEVWVRQLDALDRRLHVGSWLLGWIARCLVAALGEQRIVCFFFSRQSSLRCFEMYL